MNRFFTIILIAVFLLIGINTIFYFTIYNQQLDFQTELLARQTEVCGNTIEQEGMQFENELNSIPYQSDFTKLFIDETIKQSGSINLQKLYTGYSQLINKITVYDDSSNVYSLILDSKNHFVSDYYESQRQVELNGRDRLFIKDERYYLSIPGFDEFGNVCSNILVDLNFTRFVDDVFQRYKLENVLWQSLVSYEGELISTSGSQINIANSDLRRIANALQEEQYGSFVHSISIDSTNTKVISVYYPVRLVKRDLGILFSIKADLFLRSIIIKLVLITIFSLVLLAAMFWVYFRIVKIKSVQHYSRRFSEESLEKTMDILPLGLMFIDPDGSIRVMNKAARNLLDLDIISEKLAYTDTGLTGISGIVDDSVYQRTFGPGKLKYLRHSSGLKHIYQMEWNADIAGTATRVVLLFDVSKFEVLRKRRLIASSTRKEILDDMIREINQPINLLIKSINKIVVSGKTGDEDLDTIHKASSLLSNIIPATLEFAGKETIKAVTEEIPFYFRPEIDLALDPFRGNQDQVSIITKIRNDVPDKLIGDPISLRQIIRLLTENAVSHTKQGRILVSAETLEVHHGIIKLQFHIEDTGVGLSAGKLERITDELIRGKISPGKESDPFRQNIAHAFRNISLMKGLLSIVSPSSISTSPDFPGTKYSFFIELYTAENIRENTVFKEILDKNQVNCLVLSQQKETNNSGLDIFSGLGFKINQLVYRRENIQSLKKLVREKASSLHMVIIMHSIGENGFDAAEELIRNGITINQVVILLSSEHNPDNYSISRVNGIDYYLEEPVEKSHVTGILRNHFPELAFYGSDKLLPEIVPSPDISILLVEDNLFSRKVIESLFKKLGFEMDHAVNGREAIQMIGKNKYDIVFMDLVMPEMDGLQAIAEIRKNNKELPVIALTAVESADTKRTAMQAGFDDYLTKPATEEKILRIISKEVSKSI